MYTNLKCCVENTRDTSWAVVAHTFNLSTWEAYGVRSLWVRGQPDLQTLSWKTKKKKNTCDTKGTKNRNSN